MGRIVNLRKLQDKAASCKVQIDLDEFAPDGAFLVRSPSESKYQVYLLDTSGATCTCDWGKMRDAEDEHRSACAHVQAVYLYLSDVAGVEMIPCLTIEEAKGISGKVLDIGDGVVFAVLGKKEMKRSTAEGGPAVLG